ncbi:hypothetical protein T12_14320, partial [Trichinella patagoniensis]
LHCTLITRTPLDVNSSHESHQHSARFDSLD